MKAIRSTLVPIVFIVFSVCGSEVSSSPLI